MSQDEKKKDKKKEHEVDEGRKSSENPVQDVQERAGKKGVNK